MVKMIWKQIKLMSGDGERKLSLFLMGLGSMNDVVQQSQDIQRHQWVSCVESWLSEQISTCTNTPSKHKNGVSTEGKYNSVSHRWEQFFAAETLCKFS